MIAPKVGKPFIYQGMKIKAVPETDDISCSGCLFFNNDGSCNARELRCSGLQRKGGVGVIFVEVQK